jgi:hypothetical protein
MQGMGRGVKRVVEAGQGREREREREREKWRPAMSTWRGQGENEERGGKG